MEPEIVQLKESDIKKSYTLVYILAAVIFGLSGYIGYLYNSNDLVNKGQLLDKYILKTDINFNKLPASEKSRYIDFYEHNNQIAALNKQIQQLKKDKQSTTPPKVIEKIVEVEKIVKVPVEKIVEIEKVVEKIVEVEKIVKVAVPISNEIMIEKKVKKSNLSFNTYTCKDLGSGSVKISKKCKKELYSFLDKNKKSDAFEVIGMVDNQDFKLINTLKDVYGEKRIKHLSKYSQIGLSRQRVIEATWLIRQHLGKHKNITTVNYTVNSKDKKGFVIRAYK